LNKNVKYAFLFRYSAVALNLLYYAIVARFYSSGAVTSLFLYITIITAGEMMICGALEPQIMQGRFDIDARKRFFLRFTLAFLIIVFATTISLRYLVFLAVLSNAYIRKINAMARRVNRSWALVFDGQLQSLLNVTLAIFCYFYEDLLIAIPFASSLIVFGVVNAVSWYDKVPKQFDPKTNVDGRVDFAIYLQFFNYSFQSLMVAVLAGSQYRDIFLAQRFGDSLMNFSRMLQWTNVEKIRNGGGVYDYSGKELGGLAILVIVVIFCGVFYGTFFAKVSTDYFIYLPAFTLVALAAVLYAKLTQVMVRNGEHNILFFIRLIQLLISFIGGVVGYLLSSIIPIIVFTAISHASASVFINGNKYSSAICR
jgi:hypothetical protein